MLKNADCTIYEKDSFTPHIIRDVYWFDSRGMTVAKGGMQIADSVLVYLYDTDYVPKAGDMVVKGECDFCFRAESQQSISESMQEFRKLCPENSQCWLTCLGYGNGVYIGVDTQNGMVYQSADCVNWAIVGDVQIMPQNVTSIWHVNGNFYFACSDNIIGAALKTENYSRVVDYTAMWSNVTAAGTVQAVYEHFGNEFFVTDSGIVSGNPGGGEIRRLAFLEEAPDDPYLANTLAFWNDHLVMFEGNLGFLYVMPMRYPYDTRGNFIEPEWYFYRDGNWQEQLSPLGVCSCGENLLVFTDRHVYCIDRNGDIRQLTTTDINVNGMVQCAIVGDKTLLVCTETSAYQFFLK